MFKRFHTAPAVLLLALLLAAIPLAARDKAPAWAIEAMRKPVPADLVNDDTSGLILLDHQSRGLDAKGSVERDVFRVFRILNEEGRDDANLRISFLKKGGKLRELEAWYISPAGDVTRFKERDFMDFEAGGSDTLYSEYHYKYLDLGTKAVPNSVIAVHYSTRDPATVAQFWWEPLGEWPVIDARLDLTLPKGWEPEAIPLGDLAPLYTQDREVHSWSLVNQPGYWSDEKDAPSVLARCPSMGIRIRIPEGARTNLRSINTWEETAVYISQFMDPPAVPDAAIRAKAQELTAGASTEWEKLQALAAFVQKANYVSVEVDMAHAGGLKPFPAPEVLRRNYGDCKDLTALIRALAESVGFKTYSVGARINDGYAIPDYWPTSFAFNHCIAAIQVSDAIEAEAVVQHPVFGNLLIFDPTSSYSPIGWLNEGHESRRIMIDAQGTTGLINLPQVFSNKVVRQVDVTLDENGSIGGTLTQERSGTSAISQRASLDKVDAKVMNETWRLVLQDAAPRVKIDNVANTDDFASNAVVSKVDFTVPIYARRVGDLLLLKPLVCVRSQWRPSQKDGKPRKLDIFQDNIDAIETTRIALPEGYLPESLPEPVKIEASFGTYSLDMAMDGAVLTVNRSLKTDRRLLPPEAFDEYKAFWEGIARADQTAITLKKVAAVAAD